MYQCQASRSSSVALLDANLGIRLLNERDITNALNARAGEFADTVLILSSKFVGFLAGSSVPCACYVVVTERDIQTSSDEVLLLGCKDKVSAEFCYVIRESQDEHGRSIYHASFTII